MCSTLKNFGNKFEVFTSPGGKGYLQITGFRFGFELDADAETQDIKISFFASRLAEYYLDLLSAISSQPTQKLYYTLEIHDKDMLPLFKANIDKLIPVISLAEIDMSAYRNALEDTSLDRIQNVRYYYSGVTFINSRLPEFAIREFFKIIESHLNEPDFVHFEKFKVIRDLLSHSHKIVERASKKFLDGPLKEDFKYDMLGNKVVIDTYDPNNRQSLNKIARQLMDASKEIVFGA